MFQYTNSREKSITVLVPSGPDEVLVGLGKWGRAGTADSTIGEICPPLAVLYGASCPLNEALVPPFSCWAAGLSKGLFVGVLLRMDLVIQKILC